MYTPSYYGSYYDNYFIKPKNANLKNMCFVISTIKDTKSIIEIKIVSQEQVDTYLNNNSFKAQMSLIKSLFK